MDRELPPGGWTGVCVVCGQTFVRTTHWPKFACSRDCWKRHLTAGEGDCRPFFGPNGCGEGRCVFTPKSKRPRKGSVAPERARPSGGGG